MSFYRSLIFSVFLFCIVFTSCSFNYGSGVDAGDIVPEMILENASVDRYENAVVSINFSARIIEMYDADRIWAAEDISFIQYTSDGTGALEAEGSAGLLLVDDANEVYSLGKGTSFHLITDNLFLQASDLRWSKKTHQLSGEQASEVELGKDDGTVIRGTGFFADTLSRTYSFDQAVSGQLVNGEVENGDRGKADVTAADDISTENDSGGI